MFVNIFILIITIILVINQNSACKACKLTNGII